jgi:acyl-CoA thioester hydrolase
MIECYRGVVHPWLCDQMGHMTTRHYVAMFDDASYHLLAATGFTPDHLDRGIGFADVRMTIEYKAELRAGELVLITGAPVACGQRSMTARYRMVALASGAEAATLDSVTVQFDLHGRKAIPLRPEIREGAQALMA